MTGPEMYRQWVLGNLSGVVRAMIDCMDTDEIHEFAWLLRKNNRSAGVVFVILLDMIDDESNRTDV